MGNSTGILEKRQAIAYAMAREENHMHPKRLPMPASPAVTQQLIGIARNKKIDAETRIEALKQLNAMRTTGLLSENQIAVVNYLTALSNRSQRALSC